MVKLMRGGKNQPRGEMHFPRGRGFPRFPIQPPPMRGQHMPLRSHNHFSRPPLPYRPPLPPCPRGRPFLGPIPPSQFAHKHPLPPLGMGPLTPRSGLPIGPEGGSYPPRLIGPPHSIPPGPSRGPYVPLGSSYNNTRQPFRQIRKPGPVKRVGVMNGKTKQKSKRKSKPKERSESSYYCEACDRGWSTEEALNKHNSEHKTCGLEGCTLSAHPKVIEKHIQQQHFSGLFKRITSSYKPEDVTKWIADRKSRFPTQANIEKKKTQQEEMLARGERMPQDDRCNRRYGRHDRRQFSNRGRGGRKRRHPNMNRKQKDDIKQESVEDNDNLQTEDGSPAFQFLKADKSWEDSWRGDLPQFPGTAAFPEIKQEVINPTQEEEFSDDEWQNNLGKAAPVKPVFVSQALATLCGVYASDSEDDEADEPPAKKPNNCTVTDTNQKTDYKEIDNNVNSVINNFKNEQNVKEKSNSVDNNIEEDIDSDSAPDEAPIIHEDKELQVTNRSSEDKIEAPEENTDSKQLFEKRNSVEETNIRTQHKSAFNTRFTQKRRKLTLLEKLLKREISHERNMILQCVRYVVQNNFLNEV